MKASLVYKECLEVKQAIEAQIRHWYAHSWSDIKDKLLPELERWEQKLNEVRERCFKNQWHFEKRTHVWQVTFINNRNRNKI
jgi:predicted transcriptional regulator